MITVYNLKNEIGEIKSIQNKIKQGLSGYRTKWGLYGTAEWFENIKNETLIEIIEGEISDVFMGGHNDFPMFSVFDGKSTFQFAIKGKENLYKICKKIRIEGIRNEFIHPSSGLEKLLIPIKIEIEN